MDSQCWGIPGVSHRFPFMVLKEKSPNLFSLSHEGLTVGSLEPPQTQEEYGVWKMSQLMGFHCWSLHISVKTIAFRISLSLSVCLSICLPLSLSPSFLTGVLMYPPHCWPIMRLVPKPRCEGALQILMRTPLFLHGSHTCFLHSAIFPRSTHLPLHPWSCPITGMSHGAGCWQYCSEPVHSPNLGSQWTPHLHMTSPYTWPVSGSKPVSPKLSQKRLLLGLKKPRRVQLQWKVHCGDRCLYWFLQRAPWKPLSQSSVFRSPCSWSPVSSPNKLAWAFRDIFWFDGLELKFLLI